MKYFAAFLMMKDQEKNAIYREQHMDFLLQKEKEGKIFARGRFTEGKGGLVIYIADSFEEAMLIAQSDPLVASGARTLELYQWEMKVAPNQ
ncbi:MAG: hypothetical protein JXA73_19145 [Acidobacteria bacterium]|nr:hypothetical protein [Acidobacteriota bacterium]